MKRPRLFRRAIMPLFVFAYLGMGIFHTTKLLPTGISATMPLRAVGDVRFLADNTYLDGEGERRSEQAIFDEILSVIAGAKKLIVLDVFLFNTFGGDGGKAPRHLAAELTDALIAQTKAVPELQVVLITDPVNTLYDGAESPHLQRLKAAGVQVVMTDLTQLRDSNPSWSAFWRVCCQWFGNSPEGGWLPSPVGPEKVGLRTYLTLLNFNANHRKTIVADQGDTWVGLVTSANPHDASSAHDNVALRFTGAAALDLLQTERAVARFSDAPFPEEPLPEPVTGDTKSPRLQILTESRIREAVLTAINSAGVADKLRIEVFYLSHREVVEAIKAAAERGVDLRILLDPNKDAFGREKNGIPNRQVAQELVDMAIPVRWCDTHGEQCHGKFLMLTRGKGDAELILGSANFTSRNLDDHNLETNVRLVAPSDHRVMQDAAQWFETYWNNEPDRNFSVPYETYADPSAFRYWSYRFMEASGWSTF